MEVRGDLKYTEEHEWINIVGNVATIGITDFGQDKLGDIIYVELPEIGTIVEAGEVIGNIESEKSEAELNCPVSGEVIEINKSLESEPELVNTDPYDEGWMVKLQIDPLDFDQTQLMTEDEYEDMTEK